MKVKTTEPYLSKIQIGGIVSVPSVCSVEKFSVVRL